SAAASGSPRLTRHARARGLERAASRDADRQRDRRADDAAAPQGRRRRRPAAHSYRPRRRVRAPGRRAVSVWWSTASIRTKLTAQYALVLSLMLVVCATATYVAVRHEFL